MLVLTKQMAVLCRVERNEIGLSSRFIKVNLIRRNEIKRHYWNCAVSQLLLSMHEARRDSMFACHDGANGKMGIRRG